MTPFEDSQKVHAFLTTLSTEFGGTWQPVNEVFSYISVSGNWDNVQFNPSRGYLVKLFVNTVTGEVKAFPLRMFTPQPVG
jgi:hypothetical protein